MDHWDFGKGISVHCIISSLRFISITLKLEFLVAFSILSDKFYPTLLQCLISIEYIFPVVWWVEELINNWYDLTWSNILAQSMDMCHLHMGEKQVHNNKYPVSEPNCWLNFALVTLQKQLIQGQFLIRSTLPSVSEDMSIGTLVIYSQFPETNYSL